MLDCVFCKIVKKEIPKELDYEDKDVVVFKDINPIKPVHLLIVAKEHIPDLVVAKDTALFGKLFAVVQKMVEKKGLEHKGYRITINGGGAQIVKHLHIHLTGPMGRHAAW